MPIKLAPNFAVPDDASTQTWAFIGQRHTGKTHNCGVLVEGLLELGVPTCIVDRVGNWRGLRLLADGKTPGYPIPVFGTDKSDITISPSHGKKLATLIVERRISAVVDISAFDSEADMNRFTADFVETFFRACRDDPWPRTIVFEEAQEVAPQMAKGKERLLGAVQRTVRMGRNYGIGSVLISQRPQSISKEVINQVECLCVGRLNGEHERKAIERWVVKNGLEKGWTDKLVELQQGQMMVWSPSWLEKFVKLKFGRKKTFDSSATPKFSGKPTKRVELPALDFDALRKEFEDKPVPARRATPATARNEDTAPAEWVLGKKQLEETRRELATLHKTTGQERTRLSRELEGLASRLLALHAELSGVQKALQALPPSGASSQPERAVRAPSPAVSKPVRNISAPAGSPGPLRAGAMRMLGVLAAFHPGTMSRAQIAMAAKVKKSSGSFSTYWGELLRAGWMVQASDGNFTATDAGLRAANVEAGSVPETTEGRVEFWKQRLRGGARAMLDLVVDHPEGITRAELAAKAGVALTSGTFSTYVGELLRNRLALKDGTTLKPHPWILCQE